VGPAIPRLIGTALIMPKPADAAQDLGRFGPNADVMRTTLVFDDALLRQLLQKALDSGKPFKQVVNETLQAGLRQAQAVIGSRCGPHPGQSAGRST
jgi:hypothetical protein